MERADWATMLLVSKIKGREAESKEFNTIAREIRRTKPQYLDWNDLMFNKIKAVVDELSDLPDREDLDEYVTTLKI